MRAINCINREWLYKNEFKEAFVNVDYDYSDFEKVELPHTNIELPYNYFDENLYQFVSCYVKKIDIDKVFEGKKIFLDFEGVMIYAKVYCNGNFVCEHKGGYTYFEADITEYINFDKENTIVVMVDSTERSDVPPYGKVVDYLTYGGIYREVSLRIVENTYVKNMYLKTNDCLNEYKSLQIDIELNVDKEDKYEIEVILLDDDKEISKKTYKKSLKQDEELVGIKIDHLKNIQLWDIDNPKLYNVVVNLIKDKEIVDNIKDRIGFRNCEFKNDGFYLNNKLVKLIGLNRHQSYPYVGYAMPKRIQEKDADILKNELGVNIVRCSHYPQSKHFLNRCDEIGLLVFEEIPGWQHIGNKEWQDVAVLSVSEMIKRDFNHPSIIIWGVRINESFDNHNFYLRTNEVAHSLDNTRQTGGVRYIQGSEFLEDVYTFNDFVHSGGQTILRTKNEVTMIDEDVPYLVTENNGHIYPTKRFDQEDRILEHAKRHLRVIDEANKREGLAGNISWCAFDYNTHSGFGSGDKICYHGISDMFRIEKYAAYAYASQINPSKKVVLKAMSLGCKGERNGGGTLPIEVFTNCDYIEVYKNGNYVDKFYPDKNSYKGLSHPPIVINHLVLQNCDLGIEGEDREKLRTFVVEKVKNQTIYNISDEELEYLQDICDKSNLDMPKLRDLIDNAAHGWGSFANNITLKGYVDDKLVETEIIGEMNYAKNISVKADDDVLFSDNDSFDATRIVVKLLDNLGNICTFSNECVDVEIIGPAKIMGPNKFSLQGGCSAFWIKTLDKKGVVSVIVRSYYLENEIKINIQ
ncbi:MAG: glycoside hydrolase family 2 TIM barrel-domain containing protein [Peptostreptococcaceae bacterium]